MTEIKGSWTQAEAQAQAQATDDAVPEGSHSNARDEVDTPPPQHPVWGEGAIMDGILLKKGRYYVLNRERSVVKRSPHPYGHNNISVGDWFPFFINAVLHGAHGQAQKGIYGTSQGVISLVLSRSYQEDEGYDRDEGDVIYYAEMRAKAVTAQTQEAHDRARENLALAASYERRNLIRVLRSSKAGGVWAPSVGVRYDGLYVITAVQGFTNDEGGQYFRYRLDRMANQLPLAALVTIPSTDQKDTFQRIKLGY